MRYAAKRHQAIASLTATVLGCWGDLTLNTLRTVAQLARNTASAYRETWRASA